MKIDTRELTPKLWESAEQLFGDNGAFGGCWCMSWRIEKGEKWDDVKGIPAKKRFKEGILAKKIFGIIAYANGIPVGWCTFGPRKTFPRLDRAPSFKCQDAEEVWSVPCFYVKAGFREQGVGRALLKHAVLAMKKKKANLIEGYPSRPGKDGRYIASFSWTGTNSLFAKEGFKVAGNKDGGKQRVRKQIGL